MHIMVKGQGALDIDYPDMALLYGGLRIQDFPFYTPELFGVQEPKDN